MPVIAAGGIADRRGVAAALALGAAGVQVGTAFLRTRQSATNEAHRAAIGATAAHETVLTRAMSGRLARGIANRAISEIEDGGVIAPFPAQNWMTGKFRVEAIRQGRADLQSLWMGQSAPLAVHDEVRRRVRGTRGRCPRLSRCLTAATGLGDSIAMHSKGAVVMLDTPRPSRTACTVSSTARLAALQLTPNRIAPRTLGHTRLSALQLTPNRVTPRTLGHTRLSALPNSRSASPLNDWVEYSVLMWVPAGAFTEDS